MKFKIL